jgi:hypothetical protein
MAKNCKNLSKFLELFRSFDFSIKIKLSFQSFSDFYTFTIIFLVEVGHFFVAMAKNGENSANYFLLYQSFDFLIKIKPSFQCFSNFYTFYPNFFCRSWGFYHHHDKKLRKSGKFFWTVVLFDWSILSIECVPWIDGHQSEKALMIDCRYYRSIITNL